METFQAMPNQPGAFYPAGLLTPWYPTTTFQAFPPNVIATTDNSALFPQAPYKPPGGGRGGAGGPHNQYGKPRRGRGGGPGSVSGDRSSNEQRYQGNNYQSYQGNGPQPQQPQQPQHYYNNYRGSSRYINRSFHRAYFCFSLLL